MRIMELFPKGATLDSFSRMCEGCHYFQGGRCRVIGTTLRTIPGDVAPVELALADHRQANLVTGEFEVVVYCKRKLLKQDAPPRQARTKTPEPLPGQLSLI